MKKSELIKEIIKLQNQKKECYFEIAKEENLEKLKINDLIMIYNASYKLIYY